MDLQNITASVRLDGVDAALQKAEELGKKINEAKTLAGELASLVEKLEVKVWRGGVEREAESGN